MSTTTVPNDILNGFLAFKTNAGLMHESEVLKILQRCAYIVGPIMRRRGWIVSFLSELELDNPIMGESTFIGSETPRFCINISLRIRNPYYPTKPIPFYAILQTLLHELAHIEHSGHSLAFYRFNARLLEELQEDVKQGRVEGVQADEIPMEFAGFMEMCQGVTETVVRSLFKKET